MDTLRQRDQQYHLLAEQAADGVLLVAADGRVADASPGAAVLLARPRAALLKLSLGDLVEAEKAVDNVASLLALPAGRRLTRSFRLRRPGAAPLEAEVSARRLVDGRLQLAVRDLAERRRAALRRGRARLSHLPGADDAARPHQRSREHRPLPRHGGRGGRGAAALAGGRSAVLGRGGADEVA